MPARFKYSFGGILIAILAITLIVGWISDIIYTNHQLQILTSSDSIQKFEMKVLYPATRDRYISIKDKKTLDSINIALKKAPIKNENSFQSEIVIFCTEYKKKGKAEFTILYSVYHSGWRIIVGSKSLDSRYMIDYVSRYADSSKYKISK